MMFKHFREVVHPNLLEEGWKPSVTKWYCGTCVFPDANGHGFFSRGAVESHCIGGHGYEREELVNGEHYLYGIDTFVKLQRWRTDCRETHERFSKHLASISGPEDLLLDFA